MGVVLYWLLMLVDLGSIVLAGLGFLLWLDGVWWGFVVFPAGVVAYFLRVPGTGLGAAVLAVVALWYIGGQLGLAEPVRVLLVVGWIVFRQVVVFGLGWSLRRGAS